MGHKELSSMGKIEQARRAARQSGGTRGLIFSGAGVFVLLFE